MFYVKFYESTLDTAKVMNLPLEAIGFWSLCLLAASRNVKQRGVLPDLDDLACVTKQPVETASELLQLLIVKGLVIRCDDGFKIHKWEDYQPTSSTERSRRLRAKRASKEIDATECNARNACNALEQNRSDKRNTPFIPLKTKNRGRPPKARAEFDDPEVLNLMRLRCDPNTQPKPADPPSPTPLNGSVDF